MGTFQTTALRRAIENRDVATLLSLYTDDAELRIADRDNQPSTPRVIRGRDAIGEYFADVCGRDMTHTVEQLVASSNADGSGGAAFVQSCQYPGGAHVLCTSVLELRDGLIVRQTCVQAWDEEHAGHRNAGHRDAGHRDAEHRDFGAPDEVREFPSGQLELLNVAGSDIGRLVLRPGWRWSEHVRPIAGTELCEAPHFQYHVAGTLRIQLADGTTFDAVPGEVTALPSGHDAWVVGDEPVIAVDWWGASHYAKG